MNILIVMSGGFDTYGPSRHLYEALIEDFLSHGFFIHLIESHTTGADPDVPEKIKENTHFSYDSVKEKFAKKNQFLKRYLYGLKYTYDIRPILKHAKTKYDLCLIQSCVWAPFMVPQVKKICKSLTVWNIQDMFPGASIANGVIKNKLLAKFFYKLHKRAFKYADYISVISEDMKKKVLEQGFPANRIEVIYDWFDDKTVKEISWDENTFVKKYCMEKDIFYVQYAGTMGYNFDYNTVIKVADKLKTYKHIVFQMVGFGSQLEKFKNMAKELSLNNIHFIPIQKQNLVSHVYSACSVCFIPLPLGVIGNSVPSKIGLLMACKRPIITSSDLNSHYLKMINDNKIGYGFPNGNIDDIANKILELSLNKEKCLEIGNNGYNFGKVLFSRTYNTKKYVDFFEEIYEGIKHENFRND